ncbi:hypothetical protein ACTXT7_014320, partial [Hymenolepis weldensis]
FPPTVMVLGAVIIVSSEGHIMTPQFLPQGLRVNADVDADADAYVETLQTIGVKPCIENISNGRPP